MNRSLIHESLHDRYALYDLEVDPREQNDIAAREPEKTAQLIEVMRLRNGEQPIRAPSEQKVELDPADADQLRALGYIQ